MKCAMLVWIALNGPFLASKSEIQVKQRSCKAYAEHYDRTRGKTWRYSVSGAREEYIACLPCNDFTEHYARALNELRPFVTDETRFEGLSLVDILRSLKGDGIPHVTPPTSNSQRKRIENLTLEAICARDAKACAAIKGILDDMTLDDAASDKR